MQIMLTGIVLVLFIAFVALLSLGYAGWRRMTSREGDLQLWRVLRRMGVSGEETAGRDAEMARAVRRCMLCPSIEDCDNWLASGKRDGLADFCPNAGVVAGLGSAKDR
jgi:hypothetical protein